MLVIDGKDTWMTAESIHEPFDEGRVLLDGLLHLATPEGFRAELLDGEITVVPPPSGSHESVVASVIRQVVREAAVDMEASGHRGLVLPDQDRKSPVRVIPDIVCAPYEGDLFGREDVPFMNPDGLALVVEVTSAKVERDRVAKRKAYAAGLVPLYLLIDRTDRIVRLYSLPDAQEGDYTESVSAEFGQPLSLPHPFAFKLETHRFR